MPSVLLTDQVRYGPGLADGRHRPFAALERTDLSVVPQPQTESRSRIGLAVSGYLSYQPTRIASAIHKFACFPLDVTAGRIGLCPKMIRREGKKPEVIVVWPMAVRRTRAAIARFPKIVEGQLFLCVLPGPLRKLRYGRRNIVDRPMMPCSGGRIGIIAEQDKTARPCRRAGPLQGWREVFAVAGKASRNCCTIGEGA